MYLLYCAISSDSKWFTKLTGVLSCVYAVYGLLQHLLGHIACATGALHWAHRHGPSDQSGLQARKLSSEPV